MFASPRLAPPCPASPRSGGSGMPYPAAQVPAPESPLPEGTGPAAALGPFSVGR